jgi:hypothetical protein
MLSNVLTPAPASLREVGLSISIFMPKEHIVLCDHVRCTKSFVGLQEDIVFKLLWLEV